MKKHLYFIIICIFFQQTSSMYSELIWEKSINSNYLIPGYKNFLFKKGTEFDYLIFHGDNTNQSNSMILPSVMKFDKNGSIFNQYLVPAQRDYRLYDLYEVSDTISHFGKLWYSMYAQVALSNYFTNMDGDSIDLYPKNHVQNLYFEQTLSVNTLKNHIALFYVNKFSFFDKKIDLENEFKIDTTKLEHKNILKGKQTCISLLPNKEILANFTISENDVKKSLFIKYDYDGNPIWEKLISYDNESNTTPGKLFTLPGSNSILISNVSNESSEFKHITFVTNQGDIKWERSLNKDFIFDIEYALELSDKKTDVLIGSIKKDQNGSSFLLLYFDENGNILSELTWKKSIENHLFGATENEGRNLIVYGFTDSTIAYVAELKSPIVMVEEKFNNLVNPSIYPNPVNNKIMLDIKQFGLDNCVYEAKIISESGINVSEFKLNICTNNEISTKLLSSGVYFLVLESIQNPEIITLKFNKIN